MPVPIVIMPGDYGRYIAWLSANGAVFPRVSNTQLQLPAHFGDLAGVAAKEAVRRNSAFLFVPYSLCIDHRKARQSPIGEVVEQYEKTFPEDEDDVLYLYLLYERLLGESSFYSPYFSVISMPEHLLADWSPRELEALCNPVLAAAVLRT